MSEILAQIKHEALQAFDGQFPNEIKMRKPVGYFGSKEVEIRDELREFLVVSVEEIIQRYIKLTDTNPDHE